MSSVHLTKRKGHYLGTEIDETWWRRYRKEKFFARGNGEYWLDDDVLCFRRYLTKNPLKIWLKDIVDIKFGRWHAGRWCGRQEVVKIIWKKDGLLLSSGFVISKNKEDNLRFAARLKNPVGTG